MGNPKNIVFIATRGWVRARTLSREVSLIPEEVL
jgi:hypothetical protein